jgi:hypothetical protein
VKPKSPTTVSAALAVDHACCDYIRVVRVSASNGDGLAEEVNIAVALAGVCSGKDNHYVAVVGIVDCGLDIVEIRKPIVINGDHLPTTRNGKKQPS